MAVPESRLSRSVALGDYVRMIWQRRWIVLVAVVLATVVAVLTRPPEGAALYTATATLRVQTFGFTATGENALVAEEGIPPAEVEAARSVAVAAETADELGHTDGGAEILSRLSVNAEENTDLLRLSLTGEGLETVDTLETYASNYVAYRAEQDVERLERALADVNESIREVGRQVQRFSARLDIEEAAGGASPETETKYSTFSTIYTQLLSRKQLFKLEASLAGNQVEVVGSPIVQRVGAIPARTIRLFAGPLVGLLLGCALAVAVGVLRPRISGRDRTEEQLGYPVLAVIPRVKNRRIDKDPLVVQRASGWGAEGVRMLRTELQLVEERGAQLKVLVVASAEPRDGKSTVSSNLAASYALAGRNAVLVHADLRADRRHRDPGPGLTDFVAGDIPTVPVHRAAGGFAEVLPGSNMHQGGAVQERLVEAIRMLRDQYDVVVVDTPPLLAFADGLLLAAEADAVVVVVRDGKTLEDKAAEALEVLVRHDAAVAGLVLNAARVGRLERRRYRRYYGTWTELEGAPAEDAPEVVPGPGEGPAVEQVAAIRHASSGEPPPPRPLFRSKGGDEAVRSRG